MNTAPPSSEQPSEIVTAAMVVIGDEILSGRTRDTNAAHLAVIMTAIGIDLTEVRMVADDQDAIIEAINALRADNTYVFTSGGIGPTHDDITADAVATAFGLPCDHDPRAMEILAAHYEKQSLEFTDARKRMARIPEGAALIDNPVSVAPGFIVHNVHVMAGVPAIFQAMLDNVIPMLRTGRKLHSTSTHCPFGEGVISKPLKALQEQFPETIMGSYPRYEEGTFWTEIVVRARDEDILQSATSAVEVLVERLRAENRQTG